MANGARVAALSFVRSFVRSLFVVRRSSFVRRSLFVVRCSSFVVCLSFVATIIVVGCCVVTVRSFVRSFIHSFFRSSSSLRRSVVVVVVLLPSSLIYTVARWLLCFRCAKSGVALRMNVKASLLVLLRTYVSFLSLARDIARVRWACLYVAQTQTSPCTFARQHK